MDHRHHALAQPDARGGFLDRALEDLRKVTWDRGPVRLGTYQKADGTRVPRWHDSEVAAIGYAIEDLIARRAQGSLFAEGDLPAAETLQAAKDAPQSDDAHAITPRHDGRQEMHRMRRPRHDPQRRLRLLHPVRHARQLRLIGHSG